MTVKDSGTVKKIDIPANGNMGLNSEPKDRLDEFGTQNSGKKNG